MCHLWEARARTLLPQKCRAPRVLCRLPPVTKHLILLGSSKWGWCRWDWSEFLFFIFLLHFSVVFPFVCFFSFAFLALPSFSCIFLRFSSFREDVVFSAHFQQLLSTVPQSSAREKTAKNQKWNFAPTPSTPTLSEKRLINFFV